VKLARFVRGDADCWGVVDTERATVKPIAGDITSWGPRLTAEPNWSLPTDGKEQRLVDVRLLPPMSLSANVVGVGGNYAHHMVKLGLVVPDQPGCFMKTARSVIGPADDIRYPAVTQALDFEAELVVVMGDAPPAGGDPIRSVLGYTVGNDVSARDLQIGRKDGRVDLFSAKALDGTAPVGPWIVTRDEFGDAQPDLAITLSVGTELRQSYRTADMTWDVAYLVDYVHCRNSLAAGDLLFTGTSTGVGMEDHRYLEPGDVVEVSIEGVGSLRNKVGEQEASRARATSVLRSTPDTCRALG
jgi:2-keto-4-pentenoate hydratase/2-oxohepta-3-ene-1,7-dioic acid hydratase in catechol pathway